MAADAEIIARVSDLITSKGLIERGQRVLVGLSGGPDSVALLHILRRLRDDFEISLAAAYINHHIRPRAAEREARFCEELCRQLEVDYFYDEADIPRLAERDKTGIEETARNHRYRLLERLAEREGCARIALGHQADDRAETILFNLLRGSGRHGAVGIPLVRGKIIRPLYNIRRGDIVAFLDRNGLDYMTDISNRSLKFARNRIRHRLLPLAEKEITRASVENIIRFSSIVAAEDEYLDGMVDRVYRKARSITPGGKIKLDLHRKLEYDTWLKRRLVIRILGDAGFADIEFGEVERVVALIDNRTDSRLAVRDNLIAEVSGGFLYLYRPGDRIAEREVAIPGRYRLEYPRCLVSFEYLAPEGVPNIKESPAQVAYIDAARVTEPLFISRLERGTRFHPYGRPGSKKAGDFLTDRKYPRPLRDELPVVYDQNGVIWLAGVEIDHRVRIGPQTRKVLRIEIRTYRRKSPAV